MMLCTLLFSLSFTMAANMTKMNIVTLQMMGYGRVCLSCIYKYSGTSLKGLSELRTQYKKPP